MNIPATWRLTKINNINAKKLEVFDSHKPYWSSQQSNML